MFLLAVEPQLPNWAQWGVLGSIILGFIIGQIVPGWLYKNEKAERERLTKVFEDKVLPALIAYNDFVSAQLRKQDER